MSTEIQCMFIKDIRPGQKYLNVMFIILEIGKPMTTKDGNVIRSCKVADKTGSINMSIWNELGDCLQTGDICRLVKGYANWFKNQLTLYTGKNGEIRKVGEFCLQFSEVPNMSELSQDYLNKDQVSPQGQRPVNADQGTDQSQTLPQGSMNQAQANTRHPLPAGIQPLMHGNGQQHMPYQRMPRPGPPGQIRGGGPGSGPPLMHGGNNGRGARPRR